MRQWAPENLGPSLQFRLGSNEAAVHCQPTRGTSSRLDNAEPTPIRGRGWSYVCYTLDTDGMRRRYRQSLGTCLTEVSFSATSPKGVVVVHSADCHWAICQGTQCTATVKTREGCVLKAAKYRVHTTCPLVPLTNVY